MDADAAVQKEACNVPSKTYLCSLARWHISSIEKEKAKANAMASHRLPSFFMAMIIITKQKTLTTTVSAFFSDKYFFMSAGLRIDWISSASNLFQRTFVPARASANRRFSSTKILLIPL
jgi:hypothetical protein